MKILSYTIALVIGLLAIHPPIGFNLPVMVNSFAWVYLVIISGLFGMYLIFTKIPLSLKVLTVYLFISCFISKAPYCSFNSYIVLIASLYFYLACKYADFKPILNVIEAVFWFQVILATMQLLGKDTLINFDRPEPVFLGSVMQYMRFGSLLAIMTPFLVIKSKWYLIPIFTVCVLSQASSFAFALVGGSMVYAFLCAGKYKRIILGSLIAFGIGFMLYDNGSFSTAVSCGRLPVWGMIAKTCMQHPIVGWGQATFSPIFPILVGGNPFQQCHNDWLQILFETGIIGFGIIAAYTISLVKRLYIRQEYILISGLVLIAVNMFFAFPMRQTQTALLMVAYLGLCENKLRRIF